uniref:Uncharacterized protein n=1 Tax=Tanacetum cinerariifolium TaxID=118510 RepID=A0A699JZX8_TANCI|nr:hypothetical protein [Tanacetum cinerariifolium]
MEEIDLLCTLGYPMPPGIKDKDYDSERDILILKDLPSNNIFSFAKKESFYFDIPLFSRPPAKPPDGQDISLLDVVKLVELGIVRLRVIDDRLGEIDESIYKMGGEMDQLTEVVSGMSEKYDEFYGEFKSMRLEHKSPQTYSTTPPNPAANPFGLFGDVPSISRHYGDNMDKE